MAWTAKDAVEEAREIHPAFNKQTTPNSVLRRALNRYHAELHSKIVDLDPHFFSTSTTISMPVDPWGDGFDLPSDLDTPQGGNVHFRDVKRTHRLNLVPFGSRHTPGSMFPAYIRGGTLYFIGEEEDWDAVTEVELFYVPAPTDLSDLTTQADLPDDAKHVCVERIALTAANRANAALNEEVSLEFNMSDWRESEAQFLQRIARPAKAETTYIRSVW